MLKDTGLASLEPRRIRLPDTFLETPQNSYLPSRSRRNVDPAIPVMCRGRS